MQINTDVSDILTILLGILLLVTFIFAVDPWQFFKAFVNS